MKIEEFEELLDEVEHALKNQLERDEKINLGYESKTIPVNIIKTGVPLKGSYWLDEMGFTFYPGKNISDFIEYSYEDNEQRLKIVQEQHEKVQARIEDNSKTLPLLPEYPVYFEFDLLTGTFNFPGVEIDNKTLFDLCVKNGDTDILSTEEVTETAQQWNKAVMEYYQKQTLPEYVKYAESFKRWFDRKKPDGKKIYLGKVDSLVWESISSNKQDLLKLENNIPALTQSKYKYLQNIFRTENYYIDRNVNATKMTIEGVKLYLLTKYFIEENPENEENQPRTVNNSVVEVYRKNHDILPESWKTENTIKTYCQKGCNFYLNN